MGLRLRWRLIATVTTVAVIALAGLAIAKVTGLSQTSVAVSCAKVQVGDGRIVGPSSAAASPAIGGAAGTATLARSNRPPCDNRSVIFRRGLAKRVAIQRPAPATSPAAPDVQTVVAAGQVVVTASPGTPSQLPPENPPPGSSDTTAPNTSITRGPSASTSSTSASFRFSSTEVGSSFECKLDAGGWGACDSPQVYPEVDPGAHLFAVRAVDPAENVDTTPATRTWTVDPGTTPPETPDTTAPQTSITGGPPSRTSSTSASLSFSASEAGSSFECDLDGSGWTDCVSPQAYAGLVLGSHQFSVRATDAAGNADTSPATRIWTIESPSSPPPPAPPPAECSTVVTSTNAAESAIDAAATGSVICLADGSYGAISLSASKSAEVTLQAEHPGQATIAGASLSGSNLTLTRFNVTNEITVQPGSASIAIEYNRITGGYMGINAGPTTSTAITDTTIRGNKLVGPFGEDALRINRYHDSADPDPYGILIEGNEITGVRENGNHSDCLQSVWGGDGLYFVRNYLHDNRCQGFFVKDQPEAVVEIAVEDNLFLRNSEPCAPEAPGCGQPSYLQIFGPYEALIMRRNTVWEDDVLAAFQDGTGPGTTIESNVVHRFWTSTDLSGIVYANNTRCRRETASGASWPTQTPGETVDCAPAFNDPGSDDFRLIGSDRGVTWAPAEQHYGP